MSNIACPKCGGPGGVLLFNLVDECDTCKLGPIDFISFEYHRGSVPPGIIAFKMFSYDDTRASVMDELKSRFPNGMSVADARPFGDPGWGGDDKRRLDIGEYTFYPPEYMEKAGLREGHVCIGAVHVKPKTQRKPRVVGHIPDRWYGAPASLLWAEGRAVTMVSSPKDVQIDKYLRKWFFYPGASAHDCPFQKLDETIERKLKYNSDWRVGLPANDGSELERLFESDGLLLIVAP